jgi:hypothetical protein
MNADRAAAASLADRFETAGLPGRRRMLVPRSVKATLALRDPEVYTVFEASINDIDPDSETASDIISRGRMQQTGPYLILACSCQLSNPLIRAFLLATSPSQRARLMLPSGALSGSEYPVTSKYTCSLSSCGRRDFGSRVSRATV